MLSDALNYKNTQKHRTPSNSLTEQGASGSSQRNDTSHLSVLTLDIHVLKSPTKRLRLAEWMIKKKVAYKKLASQRYT